MKNRRLVEQLLGTVAITLAVWALGAMILQEKHHPKVMALTYIAITMSAFNLASMFRIINYTRFQIDSLEFISKWYWKLIKHFSNEETLIDYLPRKHCAETFYELIKRGNNYLFAEILDQINPGKEIAKQCAFQAINSLNYEALTRLVLRGHVPVDVRCDLTPDYNLAHLLALKYSKLARDNDFITMAVALRALGVDFAFSDHGRKTPLGLIHKSFTSPSVEKTMMILEIFDPEKSDNEILERYSKEALKARLEGVEEANLEPLPEDITVGDEDEPEVVQTGAEEEGNNKPPKEE